MRQGQDSIAQPADGNIYIGNQVFGSGTLVNGTDWYCVYNGTENNVSVTGLLPGEIYQFQVCEVPEPLVYLKDTLPTNPYSFQTNLFSQTENPGFDEGKYAISLNWGDYDQDGNLDLLFIGKIFGFTGAEGKIYRNNGDQTFADPAIPIEYLAEGDAGWGDFLK
ncbi:hypothetical protein ES708_23065 [subsurface metagenome]